MSQWKKVQGIISRHGNLLLSVLVNAIFWLLIYFLRGYHYELSDDWFFSLNIAKGNYNYTFCSYFIQLLSGLLQKLIFPINAYMLLQLIFGFVAMTSISYVFFDTYGKKKGMLPVVLLEAAFAINVYSMITFTKTAAVLVTAGGLMVFWAHCKKKSFGYFLFGLILAVLGSFYRLRIFYSVFAVFSSFVFAYLLCQTKPFGRGFLKACRDFFQGKTLLVLLLMIVLIFGCNYISREIIYSDEGLTAYKTYNSLRSSVVDFQIPSFEEEPERYRELGVSENDIEMLRNWYVDDQGMATVETLKGISKIQDGRQTESDYLLNMIKSFLGMAELLLLLVYIFTVTGMLIGYRKKVWLFLVFVTAAVGILYCYLFIIGRCNYRSAFSIWFAATVCLLYAVQFFDKRKWVERKKKIARKMAVVGCTLISVIFFSFGIIRVIPSLVLTPEDMFPKLESYIGASENKTFALGRAPYLLFRNMVELEEPMVLKQNKAFQKCVYFGTPYYAHPSYNQLLAEKGIDNLYTALAEKDNLYFVDHWELTDIDKIVTYLNEQYGEKKTYDKVLVHQVEEFNIYQIVAEDKKE